MTSATRPITPWTVFVVVYFGLYFGPGLLLDNDPVKPNVRSARYWIGVILSLIPAAIIMISLYIGNVHDLALGRTALLAGLFLTTLYQTVSVRIYQCDKCGRPEKFHPPRLIVQKCKFFQSSQVVESFEPQVGGIYHSLSTDPHRNIFSDSCRQQIVGLRPLERRAWDSIQWQCIVRYANTSSCCHSRIPRWDHGSYDGAEDR